MKSLLLIGRTSSIAQALAKNAKEHQIEVMVTTREASTDQYYVDLAANPSSWRVPQADVTVLCAAMTGLVDCEENPDLAQRINVDHSAQLIARQNAIGSRCIVLSTNLVFDGSVPAVPAEQPYSPMGVYGRTKAELEVIALANPLNQVARLGKVLSIDQPLIKQWMEQHEAGADIEAFEDYHMSPVTLDAMSKSLLALPSLETPRIVHLSATDTVSYADFVKMLLANGKNKKHGNIVRTKMPAKLRAQVISPRYTDLGLQDLPDWFPARPSAKMTAVEIARQLGLAPK